MEVPDKGSTVHHQSGISFTVKARTRIEDGDVAEIYLWDGKVHEGSRYSLDECTDKPNVLSQSETRTLYDMIQAIIRKQDTTDLCLLEMLTRSQKQQVWDLLTTEEQKFLRKLKKAHEKRKWACIEGHEFYRVYRHGNIEDVFSSFWLSTSQEIIECNDYEFDCRDLTGDPKNTMGMFDQIKLAHGCKTYTEATLLYLESCVDLIWEAVSDGRITFPPKHPGSLQAGFEVPNPESRA